MICCFPSFLPSFLPSQAHSSVELSVVAIVAEGGEERRGEERKRDTIPSLLSIFKERYFLRFARAPSIMTMMMMLMWRWKQPRFFHHHPPSSSSSSSSSSFSSTIKTRQLRFITMRHLLLLSIALNLGFFFTRWRQQQQQVEQQQQQQQQQRGFFCLANRRGGMEAVGGEQHQAHVSKTTSSSSSSSSGTATATATATAGGEKKAVSVEEDSVIINLDHGDPTMFERFWRTTGDRSTIVIPGWQSMSYFSDIKNLCWFLEPEFATEVRRLHQLVRNANTQDRHIVVGTGSTQLFQAVLYALAPVNATKPISVVTAAPFYSSYPLVTDFLKSGLYKWEGDAYKFTQEEPYIELVTSPNNPDGHTRQAVVNRARGLLVHDLAYYWPQYTPITYQADHDIMLFTVSKSTGHAGTRIGWALVKDREVAKKMTKFIELNTIGVSKDSQLRAAKILRTVSDSCQSEGNADGLESFFDFGRLVMAQRWKKLRDVVRDSGLFSLPEFNSNFCSYAGEICEPHPAFAWLRCEGGIVDCEKFLRDHKILTRSGKHFGVDPKYVRVSMVDRDENFKLFVERLSSMRL